MKRPTVEAPPAAEPAPRRLRKLFKVLVLGGAVLATAYAAALHGPIGAPAAGDEDGGTQGW